MFFSLTLKQSFSFLTALACFYSFVSYHLTLAQTADYCKISTCKVGSQTMCSYNSSTPSSRCTRYNIKGLLNDTENQAILKKHNSLRERVAVGNETLGNPGPQPSASDMKIMKWDNELAIVAQRYANQCSDGHDGCRNVDRFVVGQNIATMWSTAELNRTVEEFVQDWYDEVKQFSNKNINKYQFDSSTGHYSQLVWANTSLIGCGRVLFWDTERRMNCIRLICNYAPAGNYVTLSVYKIGKPGSDCQSGVSNVTSNLCN